MSEEITLQFSPPEPLLDPYSKNVNPWEWVYYSSIQLKYDLTQLALEVLSPDEDAILEFTKYFVGVINDNVITIRRRESESQVDSQLAHSNLIFEIGVFSEENASDSLIVELDIDPPISQNHYHIYTFSPRGATGNELNVESPLQIQCRLYEAGDKFMADSVLSTNGVLHKSQSIERSVLEAKIAQLDQANKAVWEKRTHKDTKNFGSVQTKYALVLHGTHQLTQHYKLEGQIRMS